MEVLIFTAWAISQLLSFNIGFDEETAMAKNVEIAFQLAETEKVEGFREVEHEGKILYLNPRAEITEKDIDYVKKDYDNVNGYHSIQLVMNDFGAEKFATLTSNNIQKQLAILVNGKVIMAPTIQSKIDGGRVQITGSFNEKEIDDLFTTLTGQK